MTDDPLAWGLMNALFDVLDPETGLNLVDMGLIYDVRFAPETGTASVEMTLTTPACPAGGVMVDGVERRLLQVEGVKSVEVDVTFEPRWSPDCITEEGKRQLGWI